MVVCPGVDVDKAVADTHFALFFNHGGCGRKGVGDHIRVFIAGGGQVCSAVLAPQRQGCVSCFRDTGWNRKLTSV